MQRRGTRQRLSDLSGWQDTCTDSSSNVLPDRFKKIRHFGLYASRHRELLEIARSQITCSASGAMPIAKHATWVESLRALTGRDVTRCPRCSGELQRLPLPERVARAPPPVLA